MEQSFQLIPGTSIRDSQLGFLARSIRADNSTGQWWRIADEGVYIPPYTIGFQLPLLAATQIATIIAETPPGLISTVNILERGNITYSNILIPSFPGIAVPTSAVTTPATLLLRRMEPINVPGASFSVIVPIQARALWIQFPAANLHGLTLCSIIGDTTGIQYLNESPVEFSHLSSTSYSRIVPFIPTEDTTITVQFNIGAIGGGVAYIVAIFEPIALHIANEPIDVDIVTMPNVVLAANSQIQISRTGGAFSVLSQGMPSVTSFTTVGVASGLAIASNTAREYLALVNDSLNEMYLGLGNAAVVGRGIRLNRSGGTVQFYGDKLWIGDIHAISTVAGQNLTIQEIG